MSQTPFVVKEISGERSEEGNESSLLLLFKNNLFDNHMHFQHFRSRRGDGVLKFLINKLYERCESDINVYLPQLCQLALAFSNPSSGFHRFIINGAAQSMLFALKCCWIFQSIPQNPAPPPRVSDYCTNIVQEIEVTVVNSRCSPLHVHKEDEPMINIRLLHLTDLDPNTVRFFMERRRLYDVFFPCSSAASMGSSLVCNARARGWSALELIEKELLIKSALSSYSSTFPNPYERIGSPRTVVESLMSMEDEFSPFLQDGAPRCPMEMAKIGFFMLKQHRCEFFNTESAFINFLVEISLLLALETQRDNRSSILRKVLESVNDWLRDRRIAVSLAASAFALTGVQIPIGSPEIPGVQAEQKVTPVELCSMQILRIYTDECRVFSSRKRAPFVVVFESANLDEDLENLEQTAEEILKSRELENLNQSSHDNNRHHQNMESSLQGNDEERSECEQASAPLAHVEEVDYTKSGYVLFNSKSPNYPKPSEHKTFNIPVNGSESPSNHRRVRRRRSSVSRKSDESNGDDGGDERSPPLIDKEPSHFGSPRGFVDSCEKSCTSPKSANPRLPLVRETPIPPVRKPRFKVLRMITREIRSRCISLSPRELSETLYKSLPFVTDEQNKNALAEALQNPLVLISRLQEIRLRELQIENNRLDAANKTTQRLIVSGDSDSNNCNNMSNYENIGSKDSGFAGLSSGSSSSEEDDEGAYAPTCGKRLFHPHLNQKSAPESSNDDIQNKIRFDSQNSALSSPVHHAHQHNVVFASESSKSDISPALKVDVAPSKDESVADGEARLALKRHAAIWGESWADKVQRLRKESPFGGLKSWNLRCGLVKGGDDLRQEHLAMQYIKQFASFWKEDGLALWLRPYDILVAGPEKGVIEFVPDTVSVDGLKKKVEVDNLGKAYHLVFSGRMESARKNFIESHAAYSLIGYVLNVKDRHNGNILVARDGHVVHIDFGFMLTNAPGVIVAFENAPFKLTNDYLSILEGVNSPHFDYFCQLMAQGIISARKYCDRLETLADLLLGGSIPLASTLPTVVSCDLPCFQGGRQIVLDGLKERLMWGLTDKEIYAKVRALAIESAGNWRSNQYDMFQRFTNGIQ